MEVSFNLSKYEQNKNYKNAWKKAVENMSKEHSITKFFIVYDGEAAQVEMKNSGSIPLADIFSTIETAINILEKS